MKRSELILAASLVPLDFFAILAGGFAAYEIRFHPSITGFLPVQFPFDLERYASLLFPVSALWIGVFAVAGLYTIHQHRLAKELAYVLLASAASMALVFSILFFSRALFESRFVVLAGWGFAVIFVTFARVGVRILQRALLSLGMGEHRVVIIGKNKTSDAIIKEFQHKHRLGFHVVAQFDMFTDDIRRRLHDLNHRGEVDEILLTDPNISREKTLELIAFTDTEHLGFKYTADLFATAIGRTDIATYAGIPLLEIKKTPLDGWGAIYKRLFDITVAFILILLTLPIQLMMAIALFLEQPGRILFSRTPDGKKTTRIGQQGKPFHYFKFRSMIKDAHTFRFDPEFAKKHGNLRGGTPLFKLKDDPRVTPVGRIIRKYSLDELAEFYLVLLGRMSLVGPRPHLPEEVAAYKPHQRRVLTVKPGITGLSQISGRADLNFEEEVRLDTYYIEHWNPWLDLYIIVKTPIVVLFRKGAY
jgi:exopolysaccharide biosynthesis polyprenyl glycosylphosphotransferase